MQEKRTKHKNGPTPGEGAMEVSLPVKFHRNPSVPSIFSNHLVIQFDGEEFHLGFYEMKPPLVTGTPEQVKQQMEQIEFADAYCVANIVVSKGRMEAFAQTIRRNVSRVLPTEEE